MATDTFRNNIPNLVRAWGPTIYKIIRGFWRGIHLSLIGAVRFVSRLGFPGPPLGFFSGYSSIGSRDQVVKEAQTLFPADNGSIRAICGLGQNGRQPWPIFWIPMGTTSLVGPSLAPLNSRKELLSEAVYGEDFRRTDPSFRFLQIQKPILLKGRWTSLVARWDYGFYHWIIDCLPRLALLKQFPPDCQILIRGPELPYHKDTLNLLGLSDRCLFTTSNHHIVEEFYFTSPTAMTGCDNPYAIRWLREQFLPLLPSANTSFRKFYIIRRGKTRSIRNFQEVERFFRNKGWMIFDMENFSFTEQIQLFNEAKIVVGQHGAAHTNIVWSQRGAHLVELFGSNFLNGCYEGITAYLDINYHFLIFPGAPDHSFSVDLTTLETLLLQIE